MQLEVYENFKPTSSKHKSRIVSIFNNSVAGLKYLGGLIVITSAFSDVRENI